MGFLNKETKKSEKKREPAEKVNPEDQEELNPENLRIVSSDQLLNFKMDGLGALMKELTITVEELNKQVKKAMEE